MCAEDYMEIALVSMIFVLIIYYARVLVISRKSYQYKLFSMIHREDLNMSWAGYEFWSLVGFTSLIAYVIVGFKVFVFLYYFVPAHPEWAMPIIELSGALIAIMIIRMFVCHTKPYLWLEQKLFPSVKFME